MFKSYCGVPRMHLSLSLRLSVFLCLSLLESGLEALVGRWRSGYCLYIPVTVGGKLVAYTHLNYGQQFLQYSRSGALCACVNEGRPVQNPRGLQDNADRTNDL
jgi:hypothetical protein